MATPEDEVMTSPGGVYGKTVGDLSVLTAPRSSPEAASPTAVSATRPDTPAPPGTRRPRRDGCVHRLVFDDVNANDGAWRDEDVLASGLSRVAVELQMSRVYLLSQGQGLVKPSNLLIRARNIALRAENSVF